MPASDVGAMILLRNLGAAATSAAQLLESAGRYLAVIVPDDDTAVHVRPFATPEEVRDFLRDEASDAQVIVIAGGILCRLDPKTRTLDTPDGILALDEALPPADLLDVVTVRRAPPAIPMEDQPTDSEDDDDDQGLDDEDEDDEDDED